MRIFYIVLMFLCTQLAQAQFTKLYDFVDENDLKYPKGEPVTDGTWLYGLTTGGGTGGLGCVFKIKPDGTGLTKLIDFNGTNGSNPYGSLTLSGSVLYGMTREGGINSKGVLFKINTDGTGFTKLLDYDGIGKGAFPIGSVTISGTILYGMTCNGGTYDYGVVFRINTDGTGYTKLLDFDGINYGAYPTRGFVMSGSVLFGTTSSGGVYSDGVVFRINTDGSGYLKLLDFNGPNGSNPWSTPNLSGSTLFGTTYSGGSNSKGVLFKINIDGSGFNKLIDFDGINYGANPYHSLTISGSVLYGTTYYGGLNNSGVIFKINTGGTGYTKLLDFSGNNGAYPISPLTLSGSILYGMTSMGGTADKGAIFKINTDGTGYYKILSCKNSPSGIYPFFSKFVSDGTWLYGTTKKGGIGFGVVYKIRTDGTGYIKLFDCDGNNYGSNPLGMVLSGSTLFGVTNSGGANNDGIIFKINTDGTGFTKLLDFDRTNNGAFPNVPMLSGSTLYGTTTYGGINDEGVIYKVNTDGTGYTKILDFDGTGRGRQPNCTLVLSGSILFGATAFGGTNDSGTIFKINTDGTGFVRMYDFDNTNGYEFLGSVTLFGSALYGMTYYGGLNNKGVIFKINTDGTNFTKLIDFDGISHGAYPESSLTLSGSSLYGLTNNGGINNYGVLFKITSDGTFTKLLDFDGINKGMFPFSDLYELNCTLYATANEGGTYDAGTIFKYDLGPSAAGAISGSTSVCEGQTGVTYSVPAINNATTYIWTLPSGSTGSSTTTSISVNFGAGSVSGNVTVKGSNGICSGTATTYPVTVNHVPASSGVITGSSIVAQGQSSVSYSVPLITNATSYIWNYSGSGATINGTGNSVTLNFSSSAVSGNLTVYGMSSCGNGTISANYSIKVNPSPPIVGTITQPSCIEQTGSVFLSGLPSTGSWTLTRSPGGTTSTGTGTSSTITGLAAGTYTFTVTNSSANTSAASTNVVILTPKAGIIPKIKAKWGDVLVCYNLLDSIINWQWYKGISVISGANTQYYVTNKQPGDYWVMTTDKAGCFNYSNTISISGTKSISVYPNPASVSFSLKITGQSAGSAVVTILNSSGIKVMEFHTDNTDDEILKEIPVSNLDQGIYFVQLMLNQKELYYTKIMVIK
jgi:uncharacterized repeat protein (TIGR03803 family)